VKQFEPCTYDTYCVEHYADGFCDQGCNEAACLWDGLDCISERHFASGLLVIVVSLPPNEFANVQTIFLRQIGELLHSVVTIAQDSDGNDMIIPWTVYDSSSRSRRSLAGYVVDTVFRRKRAASVG